MESRQDTRRVTQRGLCSFPIQQLEAVRSYQTWMLVTAEPPNVRSLQALALFILSDSGPAPASPGRKSPCHTPSLAHSWEAPAVGLTHQPRRPGLDSWSVGRRARSASARARPEGLPWGQASGTPECRRWRSLPPTRGPCRPGPRGRGAAWSFLRRTTVSPLTPLQHGGTYVATSSLELRVAGSPAWLSSHPRPCCSLASWVPP